MLKSITKLLPIIALSATAMSACATTTPKATPQTIVINQSPSAEKSANAANFDCEQLYTNHATAMGHFTKQEAPKEKGGFMKSLGKTVLNNAGTVAGLAGVGFVDAKKLGDAGNLLSIASGNSTAPDPSQMINIFGTASSAIEVQRTSMRLALENGCDTARLTANLN